MTKNFLQSTKEFFKLMRPKHYIKNLLVFLPAFFDFRIFERETFFRSILAFAIFCAASSAVYVFNDIFDSKKDALHPTKKFRPIASKKVSIKQAWILFCVLFALSFFLCFFFKERKIFFGAASTSFVYVALNLLYSVRLKNIPILDVAILAFGYVLRIFFGSLANEIQSSFWLYSVTLCASLSFAFGKRRGELQNSNSASKRKVLSFYTSSFLDKNLYLCMTLLNAFYALWAMDSSHSRGRENLGLTFPLVLAITMRYSLCIEEKTDADPIEVLFGDKALLVLCAIYCAAIFAILYVL